jgi:hypothetical protein
LQLTVEFPDGQIAERDTLPPREAVVHRLRTGRSQRFGASSISSWPKELRPD